MSKIYFFLLFVLLFRANAYAQNTIDFKLDTPAKVIGNLYHSINIIDLRKDISSLGFVKTGFFDRKSSVVPKIPLTTQLSKYFYRLTDTAGKNKDIVLLLRRSTFEVTTIGTLDYGNFSFRANLYETKSGQYQQIASIDTVAIVTAGVSITNTLLTKANELIGEFISNNITIAPIGAIYSHHDILNVDSIEKRKIKLYNIPTYVDGMYLTYKSFKNQVPNAQITVEPGDVNYGLVKATDTAGKKHRVKPQKIYALVYRGQPYISSRGMYYPLKKEGSDFYFTGIVQVSSGVGNMMIASNFGMLGALIGSGGSEATFYCKLDHVNGGFIQIKHIDDPIPTPSSKGD